MGIGEFLIFILMVFFIFVAAAKTPASKRRRTKHEDEDIARLRQMQEWDRISHGEDMRNK